jgi:predicted metalloprotease with PDZ domain
VAGVEGLGARVGDIKLFGADGDPLVFRKFTDGEFVSTADIGSWEYEVDLSPLRTRDAAAHASWIFEDRGILMAGDLLPEQAKNGTLRIDVPEGWHVFGVNSASDTRSFKIDDLEDSVVVVGKGWTRSVIKASGRTIFLSVSGRWHFTPAEAGEMAAEISSEYERRFGAGPSQQFHIVLSNFPATVPPGNWAAETRGNTLTIVSSDMPFKTQSLQRLHEQLRHELLHFWIPNGVNLTGNYDWFYEGFALYQSLKLAVGVNRIRFEDFLDTLSRAHSIDSAYTARPLSLVQASSSRFAGADTVVYARGMLVAFLCDLATLESSGGKRSVENILAEVIARHRKPAVSMDGNTAVIDLLRSHGELVPIVDGYVTGLDKIHWAKNLAAAGIEDSDVGPTTRLRVKEKLSSRQKTILDKLGYNNWRKASRNSK